MPERVKELQPPRGLARLGFRLPIWLYRARLGWVLGDRFLMLTHTGRKSGLPRRAVLEVVRHNRAANTYYVAAGFGEKSDWYQNILAHPMVTVQSGRSRFTARAQPLTAEQAEREIVDYANRHPQALRELARFMGYRLDGSQADIQALGRMLPMVAFSPAEDTPSAPTS